MEVRKGGWIPWNHSCGCLGATMWCWLLNLCPLPQQQAFLITEPSLLPHIHPFFKIWTSKRKLQTLDTWWQIKGGIGASRGGLGSENTESWQGEHLGCVGAPTPLSGLFWEGLPICSSCVLSLGLAPLGSCTFSQQTSYIPGMSVNLCTTDRNT